MTRARQIVLSLLVLAAAIGGGFLFSARGPNGAGKAESTRGAMLAPRAPAAVLVVAAPVEIDDERDSIRATGTLGAAQAVTLYPEVTGIVAEVAFVQGSRVKAGDVLVRLESADQKVEVERATIARDDARAALDRAERLLATRNITTVAVSEARSVLQKAEIDLKIAELALAKRTIVAPFAGIVGLTDLSVGDLVTTAKRIVTLDDMTTVTVAFDAPERVSAKVAVGQTVTATTTALPDQVFTGKVSAIDSRIDETSRTLRIEARLPNDANVLKAGMSVVALLEFPGEPRPMVSSLAVQWDRKGSFVWKLDGGVVHRTPVQILARRSGSVTIAGDLDKSDRVVTEGVQRLREGMAVAEAGQGASPAVGSGARAVEASDASSG